jgi:hypothetical protein
MESTDLKFGIDLGGTKLDKHPRPAAGIRKPS